MRGTGTRVCGSRSKGTQARLKAFGLQHRPSQTEAFGVPELVADPAGEQVAAFLFSAGAEFAEQLPGACPKSFRMFSE